MKELYVKGIAEPSRPRVMRRPAIVLRRGRSVTIILVELWESDCGPAGNYFIIRRKTINKRLRNKIAEVKEELKKRRHDPIPEQGK